MDDDLKRWSSVWSTRTEGEKVLGPMDGWMDGWMGGWMDGWMDG